MNFWKSIVSVLIALWLPLQGYAAVAMPFCEHGIAAASKLGGTADHSEHHHDGHPGHKVQAGSPNDTTGIPQANQIGNDEVGGLGCNNCGTCHLACSPVISAGVPVYQSIGGSVLESAPLVAPHFYYPELLQRPPLSVLL